MAENGVVKSAGHLYEPDEALDKSVEVSKDLESMFDSKRKRDSCKGEFHPATVTDVFSGDDEELSEDERLKLELLMPDQETIRYLSFSDVDSVERFLERLDLSKESPDLIYTTIPAVYTSSGWFLSYSNMFFPKAVRNGEYIEISYNAGRIAYPTKKVMSVIAVIAGGILCSTFVTGLTLSLTAFISFFWLICGFIYIPFVDGNTGLMSQLTSVSEEM